MDKGLKTALIIGGIILAILLIVPSVLGITTGWRGDGYGYGWGMMGPGMMGSYGAMGLMGVFWIVVLWLIIWAFVGGANRRSHWGNAGITESALEILKKRYAKGEINKAEFEEKKKDLV